MTANRTQELRALTAARGIAAWLVVLFHLRLAVAGLPPVVAGVLAKGYLAVDFFFLLSGFVIALSWHDRLRAGGIGTAAMFLRKRVARVWPLHLVTLAGTVAVAGLLAATGRADPARYPLNLLPLHVLLLQNWGFTDRLTWNDPAWSISAELAAYLLFPVLTMAVDWRRWPSSALVAVAGLLLAALHLAMAGAPTLGTDIPRFGLVRCLAEFATGTILAALWQRWQGGRAWPAALLGAAMLLAWRAGSPETLAVPPALAALLLALALTAGRPRHPLEGRTLHRLGAISYATYLSHFLVWTLVKLALVEDPHAVPPALVALTLLLVLAASLLLHHAVERPAQRWIDGFPTRRARPLAVTALP